MGIIIHCTFVLVYLCVPNSKVGPIAGLVGFQSDADGFYERISSACTVLVYCMPRLSNGAMACLFNVITYF